MVRIHPGSPVFSWPAGSAKLSDRVSPNLGGISRVVFQAANPPGNPNELRSIGQTQVWNPMAAINDVQIQWFGNIRGHLLFGLVVALAPIPKAIAFSIIAGGGPQGRALCKLSIAVITAFSGGNCSGPAAANQSRAVAAWLCEHACNLDIHGTTARIEPAHPWLEYVLVAFRLR